MKIKFPDTVWFNTMPIIGEGHHPLPTINVVIEPGEVLPEGTYEVSVGIKGPDGREHTVTGLVKVGHAC